MASEEPRFKRIGLASDNAVVFCEMDNGKLYAMPLSALERAEEWNPKAKLRSVRIIDDGYAAVVEFDNGVQIDFASDFVLHVCEPAYAYYQGKGRVTSGIGGRIRQVREARGLTLEALAAKSGIAKPNLSRIENEKVTPTLATINRLASALRTHPVLLISAKKPEHAWKWTLHQFSEWKLALRWDGDHPSSIEVVRPADMVRAFLAARPEHKYARSKLLEYANQNASDLAGYTLDAEKWARELATT
jgi:transcriptional regulator with XRE-family HTH domain